MCEHKCDESLVGACWRGGWGRVVSNWETRKTLMVEMTFESALRRCIDAHRYIERHPAGVPYGRRHGLSGIVLPPPLMCDMFVSRL